MANSGWLFDGIRWGQGSDLNPCCHFLFFPRGLFSAQRGKDCEVILCGEPFERLTVLNVFFHLIFILLHFIISRPTIKLKGNKSYLILHIWLSKPFILPFTHEWNQIWFVLVLGSCISFQSLFFVRTTETHLKEYGWSF